MSIDFKLKSSISQHNSNRMKWQTSSYSYAPSLHSQSHLVLTHISEAARLRLIPSNNIRTHRHLCSSFFRLYCSMRDHASGIVWQVSVAKLRWEESVVLGLVQVRKTFFLIESIKNRKIKIFVKFTQSRAIEPQIIHSFQFDWWQSTKFVGEHVNGVHMCACVSVSQRGTILWACFVFERRG